MKEALKALFSSKKFITALVGAVVAIGLRFGVNLDPELVAGILGLFAAVILGQGFADHGKVAAATHTAARESERHRERGSVTMACLGMILLGAALSVVGCQMARSTASSVGHDVVDCTKESAGELVPSMVPFAESVLRYATQPDGKVDWSILREVLTHSAGERYHPGAELPPGLRIAACAVASAVGRALAPIPDGAPKSSPLVPDPETLRIGFREMNRDLLGGRSFVTAEGRL